MKYRYLIFIIVTALVLRGLPAVGLAGTATTGGGGLITIPLAPRANTSTGNALIVFPFLGPNGELGVGGKLVIWVGRSDGTSVANVTLTLRSLNLRNKLTNGATLSAEYTVTTNAEGLAVVYLTTMPESDPSGGGGGDNSGGPDA